MGWNLLAQTEASPFNAPNGSNGLWIGIILTTLVGFGILLGLLQMPAQGRKYVIGGVTFICGLFYVLLWLVPTPQGRTPDDIPNGSMERVSFWLSDAVNVFGGLSNILVAMLLLLGVFSLTRIHFVKIFKQQTDWQFSLCLIAAMFLIIFAGYNRWLTELKMDAIELEAIGKLEPNAWPFYKQFQDFLFDGLLQNMDAAMFSVIAFYILSAAYRAFRIRSVEATILLASALLVMLSLLGLASLYWNLAVDMITRGDPASFWNNLRLKEIADFIGSSIRAPGLRAIDFGIGVGALAMALRLWLGLERAGGSN
jgi:hypothetical protein